MWYTTFEEMPAWKLGDQLNAKLVTVLAAARNRGDYRFADQLRGASLSVTNNIAEGFERNSAKEFIQFLGIAKGSAGEVRSLLHQAVREQLVTESEYAELRSLTKEIGKQLANFIRYLRRRNST
jgi:four helix bundle protein